MAASSKWSPLEIRKTISLGAGILTILMGIFLLFIGTSANGNIDIKTSFLTGTIHSESAGIFVCLFGFMLIIYSIVPSRASRPNKNNADLLKERKLLVILLLTFLILILVFVMIYFPEVRIAIAMVLVLILAPFSKHIIGIK